MRLSHGKPEGKKLSRLSTSKHRPAHWDDELMQYLPSPSSTSNPLLILPHILLPYFSPPILLIYFHFFLSSVFLFFFAFFLCLSILSLHHQLCIVAARKWERHSITVLIESFVSRWLCFFQATMQLLIDRTPCSKSFTVSLQDRHGLISVSAITNPWMKTVVNTLITAVLMKDLAWPVYTTIAWFWILTAAERKYQMEQWPGRKSHYNVTLSTCSFYEQDRAFIVLKHTWSGIFFILWFWDKMKTPCKDAGCVQKSEGRQEG